jgi:hypothetical protein
VPGSIRCAVALAGILRMPQEAFPKGGSERLACAVSDGPEDRQLAGIEPDGYLCLPLADVRASTVSGWLATG